MLKLDALWLLESWSAVRLPFLPPLCTLFDDVGDVGDDADAFSFLFSASVVANSLGRTDDVRTVLFDLVLPIKLELAMVVELLLVDTASLVFVGECVILLTVLCVFECR